MYSKTPPLPRSADIEVTTKCNLQCVMCQRTYWTRPSVDMPYELYRRCIRQIPTLKSVKLHGIGEPLLNPCLFDMIRHSKEAGLFVWTYTNGTLLRMNDNADKVLISGLDLLRISVDGADARSYEATRIGGTWSEFVESVRYLVERRAVLGAKTAIELWVVGMKSNIGQAAEFVRLGARLGVDAVRIQMVANTYDYKPEVGQMLHEIPIEPGDRASLFLGQAQAAARRLGITFEAASGKQHSATNRCPWPFTRTFVSAGGSVVPCGTIADPGTVNMGGLLQRPFREIWQGEAYQTFRDRHLIHNIPTYCRRCYGMATGA